MRKNAFVFCLFLTSVASAAIKTELVPYKHGGAVLEGYLAYDDASTENRPGVLVAHEWWGLNDYAKKRAEQIAALGYVAFAVDIYGKGQATTDQAQAAKLSGFYKEDRNLLRGRMEMGLRTLKKQKFVDASRIAAVGYCFGGTAVLELARAGAPVDGVVSFHGGLSSPTPNDAKDIRCKVLVLRGADDSYVPAEEVAAFEKEMRLGKVDWQMISYGNAVHGFTNPAGGKDNSKGYAYNEAADRRSWQAMQVFLTEIFKR